MSGITHLDELLRSMQPERRDGEFVYVSLHDTTGITVEATVREREGLSGIVRRAEADRLELDYDFIAAWITLNVVSALDAVGLTAAVSAALTEHGISCNVIAGRFHDHLLVPSDRAT